MLSLCDDVPPDGGGGVGATGTFAAGVVGVGFQVMTGVPDGEGIVAFLFDVGDGKGVELEFAVFVATSGPVARQYT